jgi:hypothetical protein
VSRLVGRRLAGQDREAGVYAVLYAALVIVLIAFAAIVVDLSAVRQDRRLNRSAADAAALGGVYLLDPSSSSGAQPYEACLQAWRYLEATLRITKPAGACAVFQTLTAAQIKAKCSSPNPSELYDSPDPTVGSRRFRISWPIPDTGGSGFLNPDLAPGSAGTQPASSTTDGNPALNGCDRLGVAIFQDQKFGLASAFGSTQTTTQDHSVALVTPQEGPPKDAAALNVLNPADCETLVTTGGGKVTVGPVLDKDDKPVSAGIVAVESNGTGACSGGNRVIDPTTGSGSLICASATSIAAGACDGIGLILDHALDAGGNASVAYNVAAVPTNLRPQPTAEGSSHGYVPVTGRYGCDNLAGCNAPSTNYVSQLVSAYGGTGMPTSVYGASQPPYTNPYPGGFTDVSAQLCPGGSGVTTVVVVFAGNNYANCDLNIQGSGAVIVQGGTLVVNGAINNAGCLVMNTPVTTCPGAVSGSGATVTSPVPPLYDAMVFIRGKGCPNSYCFTNSGTLVFPQTFVYNHGTSPLNQSSTGLTLWTAPGAGARDVVTKRTKLDDMCYDSVKGVLDSCLDSRFARLTYWQEKNMDDYWAPRLRTGSAKNADKPQFFAGQGQLNVVGVFFTPLSYFNLTGGGGYTGSAAQFWADFLNVNGGANLGLSPYEAFSVDSFGPDSGLSR